MDKLDHLHRRALLLAYLSMGWMVIEAAVAVTAGVIHLRLRHGDY